MSVFRKAAVYLGLQDDETEDIYEYEDDSYVDERAPARAPARAAAEPTAPVRSVREPAVPDASPNMRVTAGAPQLGAVRSVAPAKVQILEPLSFNDAQDVADRVKSGAPVVLNLQGIDKELRRRLIDFSSGLCYALGGTMSKAADQVFLLTPPNVEVPEDEKDRLRDRGLYH